MAIYYKVEVQTATQWVMFEKVRNDYLRDDDYVWAMRRYKWGDWRWIGFGDRIPHLGGWDHSRDSHHYQLGVENVPEGDAIVRGMNAAHFYSFVSNWVGPGVRPMKVDTDNYYCEFANFPAVYKFAYFSNPPGALASANPTGTVPGSFQAAVTGVFGGNLMPANTFYAPAYPAITEFVLSQIPSLADLPNGQDFALALIAQPDLVGQLVTSPQSVLHEIAAEVNIELSPQIEMAILNEITEHIDVFQLSHPV